MFVRAKHLNVSKVCHLKVSPLVLLQRILKPCFFVVQSLSRVRLRNPRLQHTRPPCPSPSPGACSNSCPLSQWCHPTISSSVILFSSCLQSFPASGSFLMSPAAAAAAKSLQSCPTLRPHRRQPTRLCRPWDSPGITLEWVAISFSIEWKWKVKVKSLSRVQLVATPWTAAYQAPPSMGFSRQEYWSGLPLPSPNESC